MDETNVKGFPIMLTEKSLQTKFSRIMFIGVQICGIIWNNQEYFISTGFGANLNGNFLHKKHFKFYI